MQSMQSNGFPCVYTKRCDCGCDAEHGKDQCRTCIELSAYQYKKIYISHECSSCNNGRHCICCGNCEYLLINDGKLMLDRILNSSGVCNVCEMSLCVNCGKLCRDPDNSESIYNAITKHASDSSLRVTCACCGGVPVNYKKEKYIRKVCRDRNGYRNIRDFRMVGI